MEKRDILSEEKRISLARRAFAGFRAKIDELFKKQEELFKNIMDKIDKKDIASLRSKIDHMYDEEDTSGDKKNQSK